MEQAEPITGFYAPVHRALTEPILLGGAPRAVAILNGTLAAAVGLGLRLWIVGGAIWLIGHPRLRQSDDTKCLCDLFRAADDITDFLGKLCQVRTVREQLVVPRAGHQLRLRVFLLAENQPLPILVDVEAVLHDRRQFDLEAVLVERLVPRYVDLESRWLRTGQVPDGN
jgi:type IV secretory pathway TrbD component